MRFLRRLAYAGLALAFSRVVLGAVARATGAVSGARGPASVPDLGGADAVRSSIVGVAAATADRALAVATGAALLALLGAALLRRREPGVGGRGGVLRAAALAVGVGAISAAVVAGAPGDAPAWVGASLLLALVGVLAVVVMRAGGLGADEDTAAPRATNPLRPRTRSVALATLAALLAPAAALLGPPALAWVATATTVVLMLLVAATVGVLAPRDGWSDTEAARAGRIALGTLALQSVVGSALATVALPGAAATMHEALGAIVWLALVVSATLVRRVSVAAPGATAPTRVAAASPEAAPATMLAPAMEFATAIEAAAPPTAALERTEPLAALEELAAPATANEIERVGDPQPERDEFRFPTFPLAALATATAHEPAPTEIADAGATTVDDLDDVGESAVGVAAEQADAVASSIAAETTLDDAAPAETSERIADAIVEQPADEAFAVGERAHESFEASVVVAPSDDVVMDAERPPSLAEERAGDVSTTVDAADVVPLVAAAAVEEPVAAEAAPAAAIVEEAVVAEPIVEEAVVEEAVVADPTAPEAAPAAAIVEAAVVEEAVVEEAVVEEAVVADPIGPEAGVTDVVVAQSIVEEPTVEELTVDEPIAERATADDWTVDDATVEQPISRTEIASVPVAAEAPVAEVSAVETPVAEARVTEAPVSEPLVVPEPVVDDVLAIEPAAAADAADDVVVEGETWAAEPELAAPVEVAPAGVDVSAAATAPAPVELPDDVDRDAAEAEAEEPEEPFPGAGELMDVPDYEPAARWAEADVDADLDDADVDDLVIDGPIPASVFERELAREVERDREREREEDRERDRLREREREEDRERERERGRYEDRAPAPVVHDTPALEPALAADALAADALPVAEAALDVTAERGPSAEVAEPAEPTITPLPRKPRRPPTLAVLLARGADF